MIVSGQRPGVHKKAAESGVPACYHPLALPARSDRASVSVARSMVRTVRTVWEARRAGAGEGRAWRVSQGPEGATRSAADFAVGQRLLQVGDACVSHLGCSEFQHLQILKSGQFLQTHVRYLGAAEVERP